MAVGHLPAADVSGLHIRLQAQRVLGIPLWNPVIQLYDSSMWSMYYALLSEEVATLLSGIFSCVARPA